LSTRERPPGVFAESSDGYVLKTEYRPRRLDVDRRSSTRCSTASSVYERVPSGRAVPRSTSPGRLSARSLAAIAAGRHSKLVNGLWARSLFDYYETVPR
jgi:hypothetical protein